MRYVRGTDHPSIFFAAVFLSLASAGQLFEYWLRVTNQLDRRGFTLAQMERTWPGAPLASASGEPERPPKWRCARQSIGVLYDGTHERVQRVHVTSECTRRLYHAPREPHDGTSPSRPRLCPTRSSLLRKMAKLACRRIGGRLRSALQS